MDDGKPTGPKAKWWSRPSAGRAPHSEPEVQEPVAAAVAEPSPEPAPVPVPAQADAAESEESATSEVTAELPPTPASTSAQATSALTAAATSAPATSAPVTSTPVTSAPARPQPLHEPDEYSTPPYGGPGPWAPAPPVQRPMATPAHGTVVPPQYPAPHGTAPGADATGGGYAPPPQPQPVGAAPAQPAAPVQPQSSLWMQYDPWSTPGQVLTHPGEPGKKPRRRGSLLVGGVLLALVAGSVGGGIGAYIERNGGITQVELPQASKDDGNRAPDSVAGIAASALPSVVTLHVSGSGEQGTGTGFVLDQQGHILTNNHVVDPAGSSGDISVTFSGGETAKATLVGKDSGYDLAVVKVSGVSGLKPLPLGNSDSVQVGDPVVAIGAPFDLQNTVTSGIISAKERPITAGGEKGDGSDVSYVDALQTDAPINPGNSGGPLVDTKARVIGINSAIRAADTGSGTEGGQAGSIGLGFAIPINQGKRVAEELINTGKATHPVIGVSLDMKYRGDGARVGDKGKDGAPSVTRGGPGAKAGIKPGDIITKVDGQRVHSGEELIVKIRSHRPGDRLELTLVRGGKERKMTLTLGSANGT